MTTAYCEALRGTGVKTGSVGDDETGVVKVAEDVDEEGGGCTKRDLHVKAAGVTRGASKCVKSGCLRIWALR